MSDSEPPADQPRVLAEISDYAQMVTAFRARAQQRRIAITSPDVAEVAGLAGHYVAKLLAVNPVKRVGMISLGPLLAVLGVRLQMIEAPDLVQKYGSRIPKRNEAFVHGGGFSLTLSRQWMRKIGRLGGLSRQAQKRQRVRSASHAARIRWQRTNGNGKANGKRNGHSK
jgi:hypothetical protein